MEENPTEAGPAELVPLVPEPQPAPPIEATSQREANHGLRPWTMEAAMEPLHPLAPPVDSPLSRPKPVTQSTPPAASRINSRVIVELIALIILVVVALLLLLLKNSAR